MATNLADRAHGGSFLLELLYFAGWQLRVRDTRDGMFVGLATLGAWFLLVVYALGADTP